MQAEKKNTSKITTIENVLNETLNGLNIKPIEIEKYFIPEIKVVNSIRVPSTPFNFNNGNPLFLGDVFEVSCGDSESCETYLVDLKDGQYVGTCKNENKETLLWIFDEDMINVLGNVNEKPSLLNILSE